MNAKGVARGDDDNGSILAALRAQAEERRARVPYGERAAEVDLSVTERALVQALVPIATDAVELGVRHDSLTFGSDNAVLGGSNATPGVGVAVARTFS